MLSTRGAVIALVASAVTVLVLAGMTSGMLATPSLDSLIGQPLPVDQRVTGKAPAPVAPPLQPLPPVPAAPTVELPPAAPAAEAPPAAPVRPPVVAERRAPVSTPRPARSEPAVQPVSHRAPAPRQPAPVPQQPAPPAHQPVARPPASTAPAASTPSRTRNTEPCDCDGRMRRVPTHWDPPQG